MHHRLIYILGYGFSGSTVFERILASSPSILGCGEIWRLKSDFSEEEICSCDQILSKCSVWSPAYNHFLLNDPALTELIKIALKNRDEIYFIDNSKSTLLRASHIYKMKQNFPVVWIHLYRNGLFVLNSVLKRKNNLSFITKIYLTIKTALHWNLSNIFGWAIRKLSGYDAQVIRFDDIAENNKFVIEKLSSLLSVTIPLDHNSTLPKAHQLTGNVSRHNDLKLSISTKRVHMDPLAKYLFLFFAFPSCLIFK